jgi:hypothetical protein
MKKEVFKKFKHIFSHLHIILEREGLRLYCIEFPKFR